MQCHGLACLPGSGLGDLTCLESRHLEVVPEVQHGVQQEQRERQQSQLCTPLCNTMS